MAASRTLGLTGSLLRSTEHQQTMMGGLWCMHRRAAATARRIDQPHCWRKIAGTKATPRPAESIVIGGRAGEEELLCFSEVGVGVSCAVLAVCKLGPEPLCTTYIFYVEVRDAHVPLSEVREILGYEPNDYVAPATLREVFAPVRTAKSKSRYVARAT